MIMSDEVMKIIENAIGKELEKRVFNGIAKEMGRLDLIEQEYDCGEIIKNITEPYLKQVKENLTV